MKTVTLDIEVYKNYFLVLFKNHESGKTFKIEALNRNLTEEERRHLKAVMSKYKTIGFNSINYDLPMICAAISGYSLSMLKELSDKIILEGLPSWLTYKECVVSNYTNRWNFIDIKEPSAGVLLSLKTYGARLNAPKLQDLPIEPDATLTEAQAAGILKYCENDLDTTWLLYSSQSSTFKLREQMGETYKTNLMSKSDAQVAEAVFRYELGKLDVPCNKVKLKKNFAYTYKLPKWVSFENPELQTMLDAVMNAVIELSASGKPTLPKELSKAFEYDGAKYKFGIGGLHSQEKAQSIVRKDSQVLFDIDVASYYPAIILGQNLHPKHLTKRFLTVYDSIVQRRLEAKKAGDKATANSLKITINGSYGKFGSPYSFLYSPDLLIQTTLTGQLALLMLIEQVTEAGAQVKSANTDGIVVLADKSDEARIVAAYQNWELSTGFDLDRTDYQALYSRDVNNYVAVKLDGSHKGKGCFAEPGLMKNPSNPICYEAVIEHLKTGRIIDEHIESCRDFNKFISARNVKGGGVYDGEELGKVVRWYYAKTCEGMNITYKSNGNKVPKSDGAKPCMDLPIEFPDDVKYSWYVEESYKILESLGDVKNVRT